MADALEDHVGTVSIGGRTITNLRFADDIDGLAGDEQELADLVSRLDYTSASYGMEISAEKTKLMTKNTNGINKKITVNGQRLETVSKFKYLGSIITDEDNIKGWTGLDFSETQRAADDRKKWRQLVARSWGYGIDDDEPGHCLIQLVDCNNTDIVCFVPVARLKLCMLFYNEL